MDQVCPTRNGKSGPPCYSSYLSLYVRVEFATGGTKSYAVPVPELPAPPPKLSGLRKTSWVSPTSIVSGSPHNPPMATETPFPVVSPIRSPDGDSTAIAAALGQSQIDIEAEKSALARTLHDDIGGLLCGAVMDLGWIANQPELTSAIKNRLARTQALLSTAIDIKRELIENLRPTLLDNIGLYPTLRWHMKATCEAASVSYTESFPERECSLTSETRVGVFRILQEALKDVLSERAPSDLSLRVEVSGGILHCHLVHRSEGRGGDEDLPSPETSMRCRADRVGGSFKWRKTGTGRHLHLQVPLTATEAERLLG